MAIEGEKVENKKGNTAFRLNIPTLCFFEKGEAKMLFKAKN
jgi:hypothetical protein